MTARRPGPGSLLAWLLALTLLPLGAQARNDGMALIITSFDQPTKCISAIQVYKLNDREVDYGRVSFEIKPGAYTLRGRAVVDSSFCPVLRGNDRSTVADLAVVFEPGMTYYIGLDHSSRNREDWHLVVWKTEGPDD